MLFLKWESLAFTNKYKFLSYILLFSPLKMQQFHKILILPPKIKLNPSENDIYESMNKRKIQKKAQNKDFYNDEDSEDSDNDKTFEEFFSSSDESTEEILKDSSEDSE